MSDYVATLEIGDRVSVNNGDKPPRLGTVANIRTNGDSRALFDMEMHGFFRFVFSKIPKGSAGGVS